MKKLFAILPFFLLLSAASLLAQNDSDNFEAGSVFTVTMVKTESNSQGQYMDMLHAYYLPLMEKAKEQGLIKSHMLLSGAAANDDDFDLILLTEYENMAAFDPNDARSAKWDALEKEVVQMAGGEEKIKEIMTNYEEVREILGRKLMRQMHMK